MSQVLFVLYVYEKLNLNFKIYDSLTCCKFAIYKMNKRIKSPFYTQKYNIKFQKIPHNHICQQLTLTEKQAKILYLLENLT